MTCQVEDCSRTSAVRGYCNPHYLRLLRHGDPLGSGRKTLAQRLASKYEVAANGCWEWTAYIDPPSGYGRMGDRARLTAKRAAAMRCANPDVPGDAA